jgi:hypothetical protein
VKQAKTVIDNANGDGNRQSRASGCRLGVHQRRMQKMVINNERSGCIFSSTAAIDNCASQAQTTFAVFLSLSLLLLCELQVPCLLLLAGVMG